MKKEMKNLKRKIVSLLLVFVLIFSMTAAAFAGTDAAAFKKAYDETGAYLLSYLENNSPTIGYEWIVLGLARSGYEGTEEVFQQYYTNVLNDIDAAIDENERMDSPTTNARMILGLTSIGKDVTDVGGHNLLKGLNSMELIQNQGINAAMYALLAFDSNDYEIPAGSDTSDSVTREKLVNLILEKQIADGGWHWDPTSTSSDTDMTMIAVQALAKYKDDAKVKAALDKAVNFLSGKQMETGEFPYIWGTDEFPSVYTTAQAVVALTAAGVDIDKDARFIKDGKNVMDGLLQYALDGGAFTGSVGATYVDNYATAQAYYALAAYDRYVSGKTALFDMTDLYESTDEEGQGGENTGNGTVDEDSKTDVPNTADNQSLVMWITALAMAGVAAAFAVSKKEEK